jgi:uncharacterized protein (DUF305 family)
MYDEGAAMEKMMRRMDVQPSGNIDHDFVGIMIPHHQGAIEMAQAELRYGHNEQLRRIAQEVIVEQQQEINAMYLAVGRLPSERSVIPTEDADSVLTRLWGSICRARNRLSEN